MNIWKFAFENFLWDLFSLEQNVLKNQGDKLKAKVQLSIEKNVTT